MSVLFKYISRKHPKLAAFPINYEWDDWDYTDHFFEFSSDLYARVAALDALGNRALTIGAAEWIAVRLSQHSEHKMLLDYLDAAWTTMRRPYQCDPIELDQSDWNGPILGLMRAAMLIVDESIYAAESDSEHPTRTCWALTLTHHLMPDDFIDALEDWFEDCLQRLLQTNEAEETPKYQDIFDPYFFPGNPVSPAALVLDLGHNLAGQAEELNVHIDQISRDNQYHSTEQS